MEIHVYLNGELKEMTTARREAVVTRMHREWGASLFQERFIRLPRAREAYLKMRFVTPKS
jgi:hypothetical protein